MFANVNSICADVHCLCRTIRLGLANGLTFISTGKELLPVSVANSLKGESFKFVSNYWHCFFRSGDQDLLAGEGKGCAADRGRTKLSCLLSG